MVQQLALPFVFASFLPVGRFYQLSLVDRNTFCFAFHFRLFSFFFSPFVNDHVINSHHVSSGASETESLALRHQDHTADAAACQEQEEDVDDKCEDSDAHRFVIDGCIPSVVGVESWMDGYLPIGTRQGGSGSDSSTTREALGQAGSPFDSLPCSSPRLWGCSSLSRFDLLGNVALPTGSYQPGTNCGARLCITEWEFKGASAALSLPPGRWCLLSNKAFLSFEFMERNWLFFLSQSKGWFAWF